MRRILSVVALALLVVAGSKHAQASEAEFSIGPTGGYLKAKGADTGTWFAGVQSRVRFLEFLGAEGSITFHESDFSNGDAEVTQYPVQVTAMFYPIPNPAIEPYVLGGVGWYYTRVDYEGALSALGSDTSHEFGIHLGGGAQVKLGSISIFGDLRYIFMQDSGITASEIRHGDFNTFQVAFGAGFQF